MLNLNSLSVTARCGPHADRACAAFATTRYYPLGVENPGNGDR